MTMTLSEIDKRIEQLNMTLRKDIPMSVRFNVQIRISELRGQRATVLYRQRKLKPNRKGKVTPAMLAQVRG